MAAQFQPFRRYGTLPYSYPGQNDVRHSDLTSFAKYISYYYYAASDLVAARAALNANNRANLPDYHFAYRRFTGRDIDVIDPVGPVIDKLRELDRINRAFYDNMILPYTERTKLDAQTQGAAAIPQVIVSTPVPDTRTVVENLHGNLGITGQAGMVNYLTVYANAPVPAGTDIFILSSPGDRYTVLHADVSVSVNGRHAPAQRNDAIAFATNRLWPLNTVAVISYNLLVSLPDVLSLPHIEASFTVIQALNITPYAGIYGTPREILIDRYCDLTSDHGGRRGLANHYAQTCLDLEFRILSICGMLSNSGLV